MFDVFPSNSAVTVGPVAVRYGGWKTVEHEGNLSVYALRTNLIQLRENVWHIILTLARLSSNQLFAS